MLASDELPGPWGNTRFLELRKEHKNGCERVLTSGYRTYYGGRPRKVHINPALGTPPSPNQEIQPAK